MIAEDLEALGWFASEGELLAFEKLRLTCVFAVTPNVDDAPTKVGWTRTPHYRLNQIESELWCDVKLMYLYWTMSGSLAIRLNREIKQLLDEKGYAIRRDWYHWNNGQIPIQAARLLNIPIMTHGEMISFVKREYEQSIQSRVDALGIASSEKADRVLGR